MPRSSVYQISWTENGQARFWLFSNRARAIYWLNVLILDCGKLDAKLKKVKPS